MTRDFLSLVGLGWLLWRCWKTLLVVVGIGQSYQRQRQESQRVEDTAEYARLMAQLTLEGTEAVRMYFATETGRRWEAPQRPGCRWLDVDQIAPRVVEVEP